ncbi:glycosyltransferase [Arthrobacter russicus]|uniref:D-inositol 3-phosphate glycosyltransferase n=1 Tax=Arthrobacter russicus TaxID=172040 RepID=A0ABU1J935_9MICC|nr:glycosyltransferase [Arthrobacter russicus]MDR6268942.1 glycosyltransferase involved in cell wall biosynthesis [Arthrobacter russicus]
MTPTREAAEPRKPLVILIAAETYPPTMNGAAQFCYRLAKGMGARGHEIHVLAPQPEVGPSYTEIRPEAEVHRLRSHAMFTNPDFRICFPWEIKREISQLFDRIKPDVVHIQCHYMIGKATMEECVRRGIRVISTNHFMPENLNPFLPFPEWFLKIIARNSWRDMGKIMRKGAVVTTPTQLAADAMKKLAKLDQVLAVSNGIDSAAYELQPGEEIDRPDYPTVLFAGRLAEEKHVDVLIRAIGKLPEELNAHLEIVGGGEVRPALEDLVAKLGLADRVRFLGLISDEELREAYIRASVFAMPGTAELQSLVSLEAASASTPLVLADAMALPHLIDGDKNGFLFRPGDSDDLAAKIRTILELPEAERAAMGAASKAVAERHSLAATLSTFEDLYYGAGYADVLAGHSN